MTRTEFDNFCSCHTLLEFMRIKCSNRAVKKLLESFSCKINADLQDFLHNKAIVFENNLRSRTYLYIDNNKENVIVGYFTLAIKYLETQDLDKSIVDFLNGHTAKTKALPCYLLGQIAVSDEYRGKKIGKFLLDDALEIIDETQEKFGGRFVLIDSVNDKKVIDFYHKNSFVEIQKDKNLKSIKMIKPYFNLI